MKGKCRSVWMVILITVGVLILTAVFQFLPFPPGFYQVQNFCIVLLMFTISGAMVTLLIFSDQYKTEKQKTLEKYLMTATTTLAPFRHLKCFLVREPIELLKRYYEEAEHNFTAQYLCDQLKKSGDTRVYDDYLHTLRYNVRDEWCKLIEPTYFSLREKMEPEKYTKMLEDEVAHRAEDFLNQMDKTIDSYIYLWSSVSYTELDSVYGEIGFFTGKQPRDKIYRSIQSPLHEKLRDMQTTLDGRFELYKSGEDRNHAHVLQALLDVQLENFTTEILEDKSGKVTVVYNDFYTDLSRCLEDFRAKLYSVEPQYTKRFCVRSALNL